MPTKKMELSLAVSKHELGHWFAARHFGFNEDYIRILFRHGWDGSISQEAYAKSWPQADLPDIESVYTYLTNRIVCLQSGAAAEFFNKETMCIDGDAVTDSYDESSSNDHKEIITLAYIARGIKFANEISKEKEPEQLQHILHECWDRTAKLVADNFPLIDKMSQLMAKRLIDSHNGIKFNKEELLEFLDLAQAQDNALTE